MFTRFRSMPATAMAAVLGCALMATATPAAAQKKEKPKKEEAAKGKQLTASKGFAPALKKMTDATVWCEAGFDNFRGGGFSSHFVTRAEMPATMIRLNLVKGLGPVLQIAEGWTVKLPDEVTDTLMERTNPTWPCTWFTPRCDGKAGSPFESAYSVMQNWGANHGAISYGHVGADLITLCSMLRIPVCMHNVPEQDIFRPAAWNAFGMDKEGQDYRACAAYGPMYKNIR